MALIFQENLELPEETAAKFVFSDSDASNKAFYTAAATDADPEVTYTETKAQLLNEGSSPLEDLAINKYKEDQNIQNKSIVNSIISDPDIDKQEKKNALELYATGGYISSDLKTKYQSSIKTLVPIDIPENNEIQKAAIEVLDKVNTESNAASKVNKIKTLKDDIENISVNQLIPIEIKQKEIKEKNIEKIKLSIPEVPDEESVTLINKLSDAFTFGNINKTKDALSKAMEISPKDVAILGLNIEDFAIKAGVALLTFGTYTTATAADYYDALLDRASPGEISFKSIKEKVYKDLKGFNTSLDKNSKNLLDLIANNSITLEVIDRNTVKENKVSNEYIQRVYNTEKGPNGITWLKNADLAEKRLDPNSSEYNPIFTDNWNNLTEIVTDIGKDVFSNELLSLQQKHGIYSKHILLALKPVYSAETTFGTNNEISSGGAVGELQVIYPTFQSLVKNNYLGTKFVEAIEDPLVTSVEELKSLTKEEFTALLSNNNIAAILAGEATLIQKLTNNPDGFLKNVQATGDLTEEGIKAVAKTPDLDENQGLSFDELLVKNQSKYDTTAYNLQGITPTTPLFTFAQLLARELDIVLQEPVGARYTPGKKPTGIDFISTRGAPTIPSNLPYKLVSKKDEPDRRSTVERQSDALNITTEERLKSPSGQLITKFGELIHLAMQKVEEKTPAGPGTSRALVEAALIFAPTRAIKGIIPKRKGKDLVTKESEFARRDAGQDATNPNWRDKYKESFDEGSPIYASDKSSVNPDSPIQTTANANLDVASVISKEILDGPDGSTTGLALGVSKAELFNSWVDFGYGPRNTSSLPHPNVILTNPTLVDLSAQSIYNEAITKSRSLSQAVDYTLVRQLKPLLNNIATYNNYSPSHSNVTINATNLNSDLVFRADQVGNPITNKIDAIDKLNKLIDDPNLNNINEISKLPGGTRKFPVPISKKNKKGMIQKPFVESKVYIRDLNTGKVYYNSQTFNKDRGIMTAIESIEAGPGATATIKLPAYNIIKGKTTELVPEKTLSIPIKIGSTKKGRTVTLPNKSVLIQDVNATLRRKSNGEPLEIILNVPAIKKGFKDKPWLSPKVEGVTALPDIFKTENEWVDFVLKHEIAHAGNPANPKVENRASYENRINRIALKEFKNQFSKDTTNQFEVVLETKTDYNVITQGLSPIEIGNLKFNWFPGKSIIYNPNTRIKHWDVFSWIHNNMREAKWVTRELTDLALENDYLSSRMQNEIINVFASYRNKNALDYLLRDMKKNGLSINDYTDVQLFSLFSPTINYSKLLERTRITSVKQLPALREAANAFEQLTRLTRKVMNQYEINRLTEEGYNLGAYENISNRLIAPVSDRVVSEKNNPVTLEIDKILEDGSLVTELRIIDIPWITANVKKVMNLSDTKVINFEYSKELSLANNKGQVVDTEGRILVKLSKPVSGLASNFSSAYSVSTRKPMEQQNFYKEDSLGSIKETYPDLPDFDDYTYGVIDPTTSKLSVLSGDLIPSSKGYLPQVDASPYFVDIVPLKAVVNGTLLYDWRTQTSPQGIIVGGKYNPSSKRAEPVTENQARTLAVLQKRRQSIARASTKKEALKIVNKLKNSSLYKDYVIYSRQASESSPKEMFNYEEAGQVLYDSELANAKDMSQNMVGRTDIKDEFKAMVENANNAMKRNLNSQSFDLFKKQFVEEFKEFLPAGGRYPRSVSEIGKSIDKTTLTKELLNKLNTAKNQYETYSRRLGEVEVGLSDIAKQKILHYLSDIIEFIPGERARKTSISLRREGNESASSAMLLQRSISTLVIAGSPIKQLLLQLSPAIEATIASGLKADALIVPKIMSDALILRAAPLLTHPDLKAGGEGWNKKMTAALKFSGWTDIEIPYLIREINRTLSQVDKNIIISEIITQSEVLLNPNFYDKATGAFKGVIGAPGNVGRNIGFKQSESMTSVVSVLYSILTFKERNPGKNWWEDRNRAEVATNAYNFKGSMTKFGAMPWSHNALGQIMTFLQYNHKVTVAALHEGGFGLTNVQRGKLFVSKSIMWGPQNLPIWGLYVKAMGTILAINLLENDEEKFAEEGIKNPKAEARKQGQLNYQDSLPQFLSNLEGGVADWMWKSAFKITGKEAPSGFVLSEGMATRDIGLFQIAKELYKLFDKNDKTNPSIASLSVPGKIAAKINEAMFIWTVPDSSRGAKGTADKVKDTFVAVLSAYKSVSDIQKALVIHANEGWVTNKNGAKLYNLEESDIWQIALGWGDPTGNAYFKALFKNLDRKTLMEENAKLLHQNYTTWADKYRSGDIGLPEAISNLENDMPWLLLGLSEAQKWTKVEHERVVDMVLSLERRKLKGTGAEDLLDLMIETGVSESMKNDRDINNWLEKYAPEGKKEYDKIFIDTPIDNKE